MPSMQAADAPFFPGAEYAEQLDDLDGCCRKVRLREVPLTLLVGLSAPARTKRSTDTGSL